MRVHAVDVDQADLDRSATPPASTPAQTVLMLEVFGRILSLHRRQQKLSQQDMAARLGWPQSVVSKVENGEVHLTVEQLDAWVSVIEGLGDRGAAQGQADLSGGAVFDLADDLAEALDEEGYEVRWGTGRLYNGTRLLLRGSALEEVLLDLWPPDWARIR